MPCILFPFFQNICFYFFILSLRLVFSTVYVDQGSINGNGSIDSPFSQLEEAFNSNFTNKNEFFLFPSALSYNITSPKVFEEDIVIIGADSTSVNFLINNQIIIKNKLELVNLTIKSSLNIDFNEKYLILVDTYGNFIIKNCSVKNLESFAPLKNFILIMKFGSFFLNSSEFTDISNNNIELFFNADSQSQIFISDSFFTNIKLNDSEMFSLNFATILVINSTFFDIWCWNKQSYDLAFFKLYNSYVLIKNISLLSLKLFEYSLIGIRQNNEYNNSEMDAFKNIFSNILISDVYCSSENELAFIKINIESNQISLKMETVTINNITVSGKIIEITNQNISILREIYFILSNSERHISIKNSEYFEIHDSFFYFSNLLFYNGKQKDANIYFDNVKIKKLENISIENCFSQTTAAIILQSNDALASYSTTINNSYFFNNTASYINNIEIGAVIFAVGNEKIDILNSKFFKNSLVTLQNFYQFGGSCLKCQGRKINLTIFDSLFFENQAIFDSNCIQFEGNMLFINRSFFNLNTNFIVPKYKTIIETLGYGGSISMIGWNLSVIDCFFSENMNYFGGNIYFDGNLDSRTIFILINKSIFIDNYSHTFGSCLYITNKISRMNAYIRNSIFFYNWANYNAALYFVYDSKEGIAHVENSFFILGWSDFTPAINSDVISGTLFVINCSFLNNTASWYPRNLSKFGYDQTPDYGSGGAIGINSKSGYSNFTYYSQNNQYIDNVAKGSGGVSCMVAGNFIDQNSTFIRNSADYDAIIYSHIRSFISLNNSIVKDNFSFKKISGFLVREFSFILINNSYFINNFCYRGEGLLYFDIQSEGYIYNSYFENMSSIHGAIVNVELNINGYLVLENNIFNQSYFESTYEFFYISDSNNIFVNKNLFINLKKNIFTIINSIITFENIQLKNIDCSTALKAGCFIEAKKSSQINLKNLEIENLTSLSSKVILIINSFSFFSKCNINSINNNDIFFEATKSLNNFSEVIITNFFSGVFRLVDSNVSVQNSLFSRELSSINRKKINTELPVIQSTNAPYLEFYNVTFENNYWTTNGSALNLICLESFENKIYILKNSFFKNNLANGNGGAIYIQECNVEIQMTSFIKNFAAFSGGAIFFTGAKNLSLVSNVFENNSANEGGAIKYDKKIPYFDSYNLFKDNYAFYGSEIAAYPIRMYCEDTEVSYIKKPSNLDSIFSNLTFRFKDIYNQTVKTIENIPLSIQLNSSLSKDRIKLFGETQVAIKNGTAFLNYTYFSNFLNITQFDITLHSSAINNLEYVNYYFLHSNERIINNNYYFLLNYRVSQCQIGEIWDKNLMYCLPCPLGSYSLINNSFECIHCPNEAESCYSDIIILKKGYWRSNNISTNIYECEPLSLSCLGEYDSQCAVGYRGPLCQSCDVKDNETYSKSPSGECFLCSDIYFYIFVKIFLGTVFLILFYSINIYSNINLISSIKLDATTGEIDEVCKENFYMPIYNKIFVNYLQIISLLKKIHLKWSSSISDLLYIQNIAGNAPKYFFNLDCLLSQSSMIPAFYLNMIIVSITPFFGLLVLALFWIIKSKIKPDEFYKNKLSTSCLVILTILQPTIVDTMIDALACETIDGENYIIADPYYKCEGDTYLIYSRVIAFPSLVIWFVYPFFNFLRLFFLKKTLIKIETRRKFGFLYNSYRLSFYFWEFVEIYKKYILILIINFFNHSLESKSITLLGILFLSCFLLVKNKPYLTKKVNQFSFFAEFVSLLTVFFGLLTYSTKDIFFIYFGDIVMILANIIFLFMFCQRIIVIYHKKLLLWSRRINIPKIKKCLEYFYGYAVRRNTTKFDRSPVGRPVKESVKLFEIPKNVLKIQVR